AAAVGVGLGLVAGMLVTPLLTQALGSLLPVQTGFILDPFALLRAAAFGLLVALIFAAPPLLRARHYPAMALMRSRVSPLAHGLRDAAKPVAAGVGGIVLLTLAGSPQPLLSALFLAGAAVLLGLLTLLGRGISRFAQRLPRSAN